VTSSSARRAATTDSFSPRLLRAYRDTVYQAAGCDVRIGRRAPDALFARLGCREAAFVTAWNPRSRRMPDGWNRRMQQRLCERLRRSVVLAADGSLGRWHEAHLLVGGDSRRVLRLARLFRQHAIVCVQRGRRARLRFSQIHVRRENVNSVRAGVM
jgi:hypothetical protein